MKSVLVALYRYHYDYHAGIAEYALEQGWHLDAQMTVNQQLPDSWKGDGVICSLVPGDSSDKIKALGLPAVSIGPSYVKMPSVITDGLASAQMIFDYFRSKGFVNFAFYQEYPTSMFEPVISYKKLLEDNGFDLVDITPSVYHENWSKRSAVLCENLRKLKLPTAIFCTRDNGGSELVNVCFENGIQIPEQISLLGKQNETLICETLQTPLSSLDVNMKQLGYQAAAQLDRLMNGEEIEAVKLVKPSGVVERKSTESIAVSNESVRNAVRFIRENYMRPLNIEEVADDCGMSVRSLQRLVLKHTGKTLKLIILEMRMNEARRLLKLTDFTVDYVSNRCGYPVSRNFYKAFKRSCGMTPDEFRKLNQ